MASYSGDINGTYAPSSATAPLYVSNNCASYCESCSNSMVCSAKIAKLKLQSVTFSARSAHETQLRQSQKLPGQVAIREIAWLLGCNHGFSCQS